MNRFFTSATNFAEAAASGLVGLAAGLVASGFGLGIIFQMIANVAKALSTDDINSVIGLATAQQAGAAAYEGLAGGQKPKLSAFALSPFMPANRIRIEIVADITMPGLGKSTRAVLGCTYNYIPTAAEIDQCAQAAADNWMQHNYPGLVSLAPGVPAYTVDWHIGLTERGRFFGK
jgi:hypothetical protein